MKFKLDEKSIEKLVERLYAVHVAVTNNARNRQDQETDSEIEARFAKLREARAKKTAAFSNWNSDSKLLDSRS